jgi:hypothetical protein
VADLVAGTDGSGNEEARTYVVVRNDEGVTGPKQGGGAR